ncbi:hypothetical protein ABUV33_001190 [Vibrio cholerae]|uniref:hypothetical protein n=1 Tax=Vibrio cholerae TaxID=666 RepID=UPI00031F1566|nr:hypothetical protein [Vibrio cholerae]NOF50307.1 hypothetical protein [Vibrio cholerae]
MKSKLALVIACALPFSAMANQSSIDEVKENLAGNGVNEVDWYKKGDTDFAETSNKYFQSKVALNESKAAARVKASDKMFAYTGTMICMALTELIPHEKSVKSWSDDWKPTEHEKIIYDVVKTDAQLGKESQAELNGWLIKYKAISDLEVECSVKKL